VSLDRHARQTLSPAGEYALAAALEAVADAQLPADVLQSPQTAVIIGTMISGINEATRVEGIARQKRRPQRAGATGVTKMMNSSPAGNVAAVLGAQGRVYSISSACSTGPDSIGHASELIAFGQQDVAICGATEEDCWRQFGPSYENWGGTPGLYNQRPASACRPYDEDREGVVMAAGAGIVVLESLDSARARGAHIYAELAGYGSANDGSDMFHPSGEGARAAARQALGAAARVGVSRLDYVNTHATGTKVGDEVEIDWIKDVVGSDVPLSSTKGQIGHAQGAAGALEAVFTLLMLEHRFLAPTANLEHIDPACSGVPHVREVISARPRTMLTVNAGLGGTNASLVFQKI
jgi:3-oxoacyl-[acyl-carrier-protein] synthase-1